MAKEFKPYSYDDCMEAGLLKDMRPSEDNANKSITAARTWLREANMCFQCNAFLATVISSYEALFHSSRAVLYRDGIREKSHYCIARYIQEKYVNRGILDRYYLDMLDDYRNYRNNCQYGSLFEVTKPDAEAMILNTECYLKEMEKLLKA